MKAAILIFLSLGLVLTCAGGCTVASTYNGLVGQENGVTATWRDSQVQYDTFWKKVKEVAQVPEAYKDALKEIMLDTTKARYEGKDPAFLMITEANPNLDPSMYVQVQRVIEAGRNDFAQTQRTLVDRQRAFGTNLQTFPNNIVAGVLGFPHEVNGEFRPAKDLDGDGKYTVLDYPTVTSAKTQEVFSTGQDNEAQDVFGKNSK
jgi:hypothetical protein